MVSDQDLIDALRESIDTDESPIATPDDVAALVDVKRETVRQRLLRLAADQHVRTRKAGRARVFWIPDALRSDAPAPTPAAPTESEPTADLADLVDELEPPGRSAEIVAHRRRALRAVLDALRKEAPAGLSKADLLDAVGGSAGYDSPESLWSNWLNPALSELADEGVVESPGAERRGWRITSTEV